MNPDFLLLATLESGAVFLLVWLIFKAVPTVPASWRAWIWRLAFVKATLSFLPFATIPLYVLPAPEAPKPHAPVPANSILYRNGTLPPAGKPSEVPATSLDPALVIWVLGAGTMLAAGLAGRIRAGKIARMASPVENPVVRTSLDDLARRAGIDARVRLVASSDVEGAMVVGGVQPVIVLPANATAEDAELMLAHEVAHLARRDLFWYGAIWAIQSLLFFNPFVWLAAYCARRDHESATDRLAIELADSSVQTYADMLLRTTVVSRVSLVPGALSMAASFRSVHQRLEAMKYFHRRPSFWLKSATLAFAILTAGLLPTYLPAAAPMQQSASTRDHSDTNWVTMQNVGPNTVFDLQCKQADVRIALKLLFDRAKVSFQIDPKVKGRVTIHLENVTLDVAVANIARQVEATYEVKNGAYRIFLAPGAKPFNGGTVHRDQQGHLVFLPGNVTISLQKVDAREALRGLFKQTRCSYSIDVMVQGIVTLSVKDVPFEDALNAILKQIDSTYAIINNVYTITRKGPGKP